MDQPLVSVIMPAYNAEKYISEAIESVINQTYQNWELIVIDDGSTDNTAAIVNTFYDKRIKTLLESNAGQSLQLNKGIAIAKGRYIAIAHADDINLPNRLALQVSFLEKNASIGVLGSKIKIFNENHHYNMLEFPENTDECYGMLFYANPIAHPAVMIRNGILIQTEIRYNENHKAAEDYNLWIRLSEKTKIANLPICLVLYRTHKNQTSNLKKVEEEKVVNESRLLLIEQLTKDISERSNLLLFNFFYDHKKLKHFEQWESLFLSYRLIVAKEYMTVNTARHFLISIFCRNLKSIPYMKRISHIIYSPLIFSMFGLRYFLSVFANLYFVRS
jgi:glycosyltransferase involved in cell wall biosynthesis